MNRNVWSERFSPNNFGRSLVEPMTGSSIDHGLIENFEEDFQEIFDQTNIQVA